MNPGVRSDVAIMTHTPLRLGGEKREQTVVVKDDYTSYTELQVQKLYLLS